MIDIENQIEEVMRKIHRYGDEREWATSDQDEMKCTSLALKIRNELRTLLSSAQSGEQAAVITLATTWPTEDMTSAFGEKFSTRRQSETFPAAFKAAISVAPFPSEVVGLLDALESMVDVCEGHDFDGAPSDAHMEKARAAISAYRCLAASQPNGEAA